jgi:hypothetical protein
MFNLKLALRLQTTKDVLLCTQTDEDICAHLCDYLYVKYSPDKAGLEELSRQLRMRIPETLERQNLTKQQIYLEIKLKTRYSVECFKDRGLPNYWTVSK